MRGNYLPEDGLVFSSPTGVAADSCSAESTAALLVLVLAGCG